MSEQRVDDSFTQPRLREALEEVRPRLIALEPTALIPINVDPVDAATTVRAALPAIMDLRGNIETHLNTFDLSHVDSLESLALALIQSHSLYLCTKVPSAELFQVIAETTQLRDSFLADIGGLNKHGNINACRLTSFRGSPSYQRIATDVLTLANLLRNNWQAVSSNCGVTEAELNRAEFLADRVFRLVSSRAQTSVRLAEAALERQKVYTLLVQTYDQVRKAVSYLRWEHEDAEEFAPSFFKNRKVGKRKKKAMAIQTEAETETETETATPKPTDKETDPFLS